RRAARDHSRYPAYAAGRVCRPYGTALAAWRLRRSPTLPRGGTGALRGHPTAACLRPAPAHAPPARARQRAVVAHARRSAGRYTAGPGGRPAARPGLARILPVAPLFSRLAAAGDVVCTCVGDTCLWSIGRGLPLPCAGHPPLANRGKALHDKDRP